MSFQARQGGVVLVESLVATTLLAVGLAGGAVLLVQAIASEREAAVRSSALRHADSLADDLRRLLRGHPVVVASTGPAAVPDCPASGGTCTLDEWVAWRLDAWRREARADLPAGASATVEIMQPSPPAYRITLSWPGGGPDAWSRVELAVEP